MHPEEYLNIEFTVDGTPYPMMDPTPELGRWFPGMETRPFVSKCYNPNLDPWIQKVSQAANRAMLKANMAGKDIPYPCLNVTFYFPRPQGHFGMDNKVPRRHLATGPSKKPPVTELGKAVAKALEMIFYRSTKQLYEVTYRKAWTTSREGRAEVKVTAIRFVEHNQLELGL